MRAMTWTAPEYPRTDEPFTGPERPMLDGFLDWYRASARRASGPDPRTDRRPHRLVGRPPPAGTAGGSLLPSPPGQVQVGDRALERLGRHGHGLGQRGVRVDGQADVGRVGAHLDGQYRFGDEVARRGA